MKYKILKVVLSILLIVVVVYMSIGLYTFSVVSKYDNKLYPNMYIENYDISNMTKTELDSKINNIAQNVEDTDIILKANDKEYKYKLKDLGVTINKEELTNNILTYDFNIGYFQKMKKIVNKEKTSFDYKISYSHDDVVKFVNDLKKKVDTKLIQGKLVMNSNRVLTYKKGTASFSLDVTKSVEQIEKSINNIQTNNKIELVGKSQNPSSDKLSTINTKVSSFSTTFDYKVSRGRNLENAARNLDGVIIYPGQTFSFYRYAGPYNKKGYVYYDGVMGNGVCQVATTTYNAVLLGGLKVVQRYAHAYKMWYVDGGLDATVAGSSKGPTADLKFKNTYSYPIYISAYTNKGKITIDFWSNDKAKNGKTYKTQSVQISAKGYKTYLITYQGNKQISKNLIATTWYPK